MKFEAGDYVIPAKLLKKGDLAESLKRGYVYRITNERVDGQVKCTMNLNSDKVYYAHFTEDELEHGFIKVTKAVKVLYGY